MPCWDWRILRSSITASQRCSQGDILLELPAKVQVPPSLRISVVTGFVLNPPQITWIRAPLCPRAKSIPAARGLLWFSAEETHEAFGHMKRHPWFLAGFLCAFSHSTKLLKSCSKRERDSWTLGCHRSWNRIDWWSPLTNKHWEGRCAPGKCAVPQKFILLGSPRALEEGQGRGTCSQAEPPRESAAIGWGWIPSGSSDLNLQISLFPRLQP